MKKRRVVVKQLSNRLEGYHTCTRVLLERITSNLVENQISAVEDNFGSYEIKVGKVVRIIDLLESKLNQYFHKWICVSDVKTIRCWVL